MPPLDKLSGQIHKRFVRSPKGKLLSGVQIVGLRGLVRACGHFWQLVAAFGKFWQLVAI